MDNNDDQLESFKQHILDSSRQNWLFGAGISCDANIPLMHPLTDRTKALVQKNGNDKDKAIIQGLCAELSENAHVEHYLSHLGDLIALSERSRSHQAILNNSSYSTAELLCCYRRIVSAIGETVRYGYKDDANIGTLQNPIVDISMHNRFVKALFKNKANLERRSTVRFFTTNYDTLLEDALSLNKVHILDGFSGGALGFWNGKDEFSRSTDGLNSFVCKLHGSVDWLKDKDRGLIRARYGTKYVSDTSDIMIYPQSTKYVETQRDPFAFLFSQFRTALQSPAQNVLLTCGYSFGDEHINAEIESCLELSSNKTTIVAFTDEKPSPDGVVVNPVIDKWLNSKNFGSRVFVAGKKGLYNASLNPIKLKDSDDINWWKFDGLINFMESGEI